MKLKYIIPIGIFFVGLSISSFAQQATYLNTAKPIDERVTDLVGRLTLAEKASLLGYNSKAVPRLGIPAYNWWNESLHGVARAGEATIFPQAIGMAATFDDELLNQVATVISTEARAKYNLAIAKDQHLQYMGLTFWSPNINIFRDPRWGRGQETYGEDPFLTSKMGTAYVKGLQGNDPLHLKASATAKHFVAHSGPEATRDNFNTIADEKDLRETYYYSFKKLVDAGVETVMSAYNAVNGVPMSINKNLLTDLLRKEWGFKGHVVTDCGALNNVYAAHKALPNATAVAAAAIKAGVNLDCSTVFQSDIEKAVNQKLLTETELNKSLGELLKTQFKLGFYDDPTKSPYRTYGADSVHTEWHVNLSRKVARQSMVLLKNDKDILPLKKSDYSSVMVVGPSAASLDALVASYHGVSSKMVNFVEGITAAVGPGTRVEYDLGTGNNDTTHFGGIWAAGNADVTIAVIGLTAVTEGEAGDAFLAANGGDRTTLSLAANDIAYMKELRKAVKKPIIAVITAGSDIDVAAVAQYADAVILAWYPGEQGGNALADLVFGDFSPSGHLPLTFYKSIKDLPAYDSYAMEDRTYRYYKGDVQYPFGYGMSYTSFTYSAEKLPAKSYKAGEFISITAKVKNTGKMDGDEVVQAYVKYPEVDRMPLKELKGFKRVSITKGTEQSVTIQIPVQELQKWDLKSNAWKVYPGSYKLILGNSSANESITAEFTIQ